MLVMPNLDRNLLEAALTGLEAQKARVEEHISAVRSQLGIRGPGRPNKTKAEPATAKRKRRMSAVGRRNIQEAMRRRWAAVKAEKQVAALPAPKKRELSAAGRAAIVAALKKRWAVKKAAVAKPQRKAGKKATKKAAAKKVTAKTPVKVARKTAAVKTPQRAMGKAAEEPAAAAQ